MESPATGVTPPSTPSASSKPPWTPKSYQERAVKLLLGQASGGLFLDPGLGKTSIVLAAFKILRNKGLAKKMLVVAPLMPVYSTWPGEIKKWAEFSNLTYSILHDDVKEWNLDAEADIYLINPEGLPWLFSQTSRPVFDILVIDESSKFKDSSTKRFKLLKQFLHLFKRRWILTGTPVPNGMEDLFGQIYILDLGRSLGRFITHYRTEFFDRAPWNVYQWTPKSDSFPKVIDRISPLILQLSAEDHLKMPELIFIDIPVFIPDSAMKIYREIEQDFISGDIVAPSAAVAGVKCRQVANGAVYEGSGWRQIHDAKLEALESLLGEISSPVLLLYEFDHDRQRIQSKFPHAVVLQSGKDLESQVGKFNRGDVQLLLGHPASMGHGLNLQGACHHVVWFGIPWNLEHYDQAIARVYRQGQQSQRVFVYHLVAKNTLDERVVSVLNEKDKNQQTLLRALSEHRNRNYGL